MIMSEEKIKKKKIETHGKAKENTRQDKENYRAAPSRSWAFDHTQHNRNKETETRKDLPPQKQGEVKKVPGKLGNHQGKYLEADACFDPYDKSALPKWMSHLDPLPPV